MNDLNLIKLWHYKEEKNCFSFLETYILNVSENRLCKT